MSAPGNFILQGEDCLAKRRRGSRAFAATQGARFLDGGRRFRGDQRVAEVAELDLVIENGVVSAYRAKVKVSFKYEGERGA